MVTGRQRRVAGIVKSASLVIHRIREVTAVSLPSTSLLPLLHVLHLEKDGLVFNVSPVSSSDHLLNLPCVVKYQIVSL